LQTSTKIFEMIVAELVTWDEAEEDVEALSGHLKATSVETPPAFCFTDLVSQRVLGAGSFSTVYQVHLDPSFVGFELNSSKFNGEWRSSSFAMKCPKKTDRDDEKSMILKSEGLKAEASLLAELNHPNVVRLKGLPKGECCPFVGYFFVMECLHKDTLQTRLKAWRDMSSSNRMSIRDRVQTVALSVASAMKYIHSKDIILRDCKPENISWDQSTGQVRVFDFGLACRVNECVEGEVAGSLRYMAPEAMLGKPCKASDVYSFGLFLWELLTLKKPYYEEQKKFKQSGESHEKFAEHLIDLVTTKNGKAGPISLVRSKKVQRIISRCWEQDPTDRPTFTEIEQLLLASLESLEDWPHRLQRSLSIGTRRPSFTSACVDVHSQMRTNQVKRQFFRASSCDETVRSLEVQSEHARRSHSMSFSGISTETSIAPPDCEGKRPMFQPFKSFKRCRSLGTSNSEFGSLQNDEPRKGREAPRRTSSFGSKSIKLFSNLRRSFFSDDSRANVVDADTSGAMNTANTNGHDEASQTMPLEPSSRHGSDVSFFEQMSPVLEG